MNHATVIREWLRDSAIGFSLMIGGFMVAGLLAEWFQTRHSVAYAFFLCIGAIPFMWFAGKRLGYFPAWEYAALFGLIVATAGARVLFERSVSDNPFAFVLPMAIGIGCYCRLRDAVRARLKRNSTTDITAR